jgi:tRNA (cmo5U34)-methyltransferase
MLVELAQDFAAPGSTLYQLGVGENDMLPTLHASLDPTVDFVGTCVSDEHLKRCRDALDVAPSERRIDFVAANLNRGVAIRDASVVLMVSTSRTVHPFRRVPLIEDVHRGLRAGGCALVVEHVRGRDSLLNNLFATHARERARSAQGGGVPHEFRHSNEELLIASSLNEECELLCLGGFRSVEVFYKWYGVCGLIAVK